MSTDTSETTTVGYLPVLNSPAHDSDTLCTVIRRCLTISEKLHPGKSTVITLDEQLYCKAKELQWSSPDTCRTLRLRLGGFHIALNYMKVTVKHMTDSGLAEVWTESSVFGENTAVNNLAAKSYNRTVRGHKLAYEALLRIVWPQFLTWLSTREYDVDMKLNEQVGSLAQLIADKEEIGQITDTYNSIRLQMAETNMPDLLKEFLSGRSPTDNTGNSTYIWYQSY